MARGFVYGHEVFFDEPAWTWRWADTGEAVKDPITRRCPACDCPPTPEGYDACLGHLLGVVSACCGHGGVALTAYGFTMTLEPMALMADGTELRAETPEQLCELVRASALREGATKTENTKTLARGGTTGNP